MKTSMDVQKMGLVILRIGMAGVLVWFGANQLMEPNNWVGFVPEYATALSGMSPLTIVHANGSAEIVFGLFILLGLFTRAAALVMAAHLALIAFSLGNTAVAVRDWGLVAGLLALVFTGPGMYSFDKKDQLAI